MPLTPSERVRTVERLRKYPAGVPVEYWGYGPLWIDCKDHPEDAFAASLYKRRKYG